MRKIELGPLGTMSTFCLKTKGPSTRTKRKNNHSLIQHFEPQSLLSEGFFLFGPQQHRTLNAFQTDCKKASPQMCQAASTPCMASVHLLVHTRNKPIAMYQSGEGERIPHLQANNCPNSLLVHFEPNFYQEKTYFFPRFVDTVCKASS